MPLVDVTSLLSDPDLATTFHVVHNIVEVDAGGVNVVTPQAPVLAVGVVVPASSNMLLRLPEAENLSGAITIYTTFILIVKYIGYTADQILWNNRTYTVKLIDDYSQFGVGFVRATATMLDLT